MALAALEYRLETTVALGGSLGIDSFRLEETLGRAYALSLSVAVPDADADVSALLGRDLVFTLERRPLSRRVCGIVQTVHEGARRPDGALQVQLELVPASNMLSMRRNTRVFQGASVPEILETVLSEGLAPYGRAVELQLSESHPPREYCVQYQESDLDFVHRLMEEEGLHYVFTHEAAVETLIVRDANTFAAPVAASAEEGAVRYQPHDLGVAAVEPVHRLSRVHDTTPTAVAVRDLDWTDGTLRVSAERSGQDEVGRHREQYEHGEGRSLSISSYDQGVRRYQAHDGPRQVAIRRQAHVRDALTLRGVGRVTGFSAGMRFQLGGHPSVGFDGDYLITHVVHQSEASDRLGPGAGEHYHNRFRCIPLDVPFRPGRVVNKPRVPSIQTAVVTGPAGEEIHTDEWGRVKVQFHWDRQSAGDARSSAWVRVQQAWAGAGWGSLWIPRIGMEVIVQFIDGDPDRPVVTGSLYNAQNPPPYDLPADKSKSTLRSNSTPGGGGFNELRFEDAAGAEQIYLHAQKDYDRVTLADETHSVGGDQRIDIGRDRSARVGRHASEKIGVDQSLTVGAHRSIEVGADFVETVHGSSTIVVHGPATETLQAGETQTVLAGRTETVDGGETRTVRGGQQESIEGGLSQSIDGGLEQTVTGGTALIHDGDVREDITGTFEQSITGTANIFTPDVYNIVANGGFNVTAPAGATLTAPAGWTVVAPGGQKLVDTVVSWISGRCDFQWASETKVTGYASSVTGMKVSYTGLDASVKAVGISETFVSIDSSGTKLSAGALELKQQALRMCVAALHFFG